MEGMAKR